MAMSNPGSLLQCPLFARHLRATGARRRCPCQWRCVMRWCGCHARQPPAGVAW